MDWWISGHKATIKSLEDNELKYFANIRHWTYLQENYVYTWSVRWINFAWHSFDFTIYWDTHLNTFCSVLQEYKTNWYNNFVVAHWWTEYQYLTHNKTQETEWKKLIDCWADLVIWWHPHVIQDVERYNWKPIIYNSLGNFLFDQDWSENTQKWIWILIDYKENGEISFETEERNVAVKKEDWRDIEGE